MNPVILARLDELLAQYENDNSDVRGFAVDEITAFAPTFPAASETLIRALRDPEFFVQFTAVSAILRVTPPLVEAVPALIELLDNRNDLIRLFAAKALARAQPGSDLA